MFDEFIGKGIIAIGWDELGDLTQYPSKEAILERLKTLRSNERAGRIMSHASQAWRFKNEVSNGDWAVVYNPETRFYHLGLIGSDVKFDEGRETYRNYRIVEWRSTISRDALSVSTRNKLISILTIFKPADSVVEELLSILSGTPQAKLPDEEGDLDYIGEDVEDKSLEFIKDLIISLDWSQMQDVFAGLLRAMGYKTRISEPGPDRGRDIVASPDGLGLEDPRIVVEVKHRGSAMGAPEIRSFLGGLKNAKGVYLSTGGFTKEAKYVAEQADRPITLVDIDDLARLIVQYYDECDSQMRSLIPLRKIYWPL